MKKTILFLCTGNSCRSQIAEGWLRHFGDDRYEALSAGIEAHGKNPRAIRIMEEAGIDISGQESTIVTDDMLNRTDLIISVCGHADEHCPAIPVSCKKRHLPFDDPAKAQGSEEEIMAEFRRVRDQIKSAVQVLVEELDTQANSV